ncbi:MAG: hypothetical protein KY468_15560 [Armatimonadetes bacterium]|nr:hypothetical protein [Armatimonadota bacterium]
MSAESIAMRLGEANWPGRGAGEDANTVSVPSGSSRRIVANVEKSAGGGGGRSGLRSWAYQMPRPRSGG